MKFIRNYLQGLVYVEFQNLQERIKKLEQDNTDKDKLIIKCLSEIVDCNNKQRELEQQFSIDRKNIYEELRTQNNRVASIIHITSQNV